MFFKSAVATALLAGVVVAQSSNSTTLDPNAVDPPLRSQWCSSQDNTCQTLCGVDNIGRNDCDPYTLNISCLCASNNSAPGLQYYKQSMFSLKCQRIYELCIVANEGSQRGQDQCTANQKADCGTLDITNFTAPSTSSSSSASSTPTPTPTQSSAGSAATTSSSKGAAMATMAAAQEIGAGILAAGVAAAFGFLL